VRALVLCENSSTGYDDQLSNIAFDIIDFDHNGTISIDEIHEIIHNSMPDIGPHELMSLWDTDRNGRLDREEFKRFITSGTLRYVWFTAIEKHLYFALF
ncbi:unnamed protein product, partial [Didymodactylos carnosus]